MHLLTQSSQCTVYCGVCAESGPVRALTPEFTQVAAYEWRLLPFAGGSVLGPIWDHTFSALLNDLYVHARSASLEQLAYRS